MIASAPEKHGHMAGVNRFRNHLINTRWGMGRRDWLRHTYSAAGYINVTGTAYNAAMRRELLRYLLTLDVLEEERAEEHDARMFCGELERTESNETLRGTTFQLITPKYLLAIDFACTDLRSFIRHHSISNAEHEQVLESMKVKAAAQTLAISDLFA